MQLTAHIKSLKPSATLAINEHSNELIRQGKKVYKLGFGQSPFPVPLEVVDALKTYANEKDYLPVKGLYSLRDTVAGYYEKRFSVACSAEDVLIGPGSKELLFIVQMCCDCNLLLPSPSWVSYAPQAQITFKKTFWVDTTDNPKRLVTASSLEKFCSEHHNEKFMLLLNYPSNPTGATFSEGELKELADVARKYELLIVSD
ncbi:MAG: aminotransferase class I/II-fold pyridoxal phosphate-dependent enzyme, partial [Cyclobacteriaceae bacterium]